MTGIDLDKMQERSFYVESMVAVMEIGERVLGQQAMKEIVGLGQKQ